MRDVVNIAGPDPDQRERLFEEAVQAYLEGRESGNLNKNNLLARYETVAAELERFFAAQEAVGAVLLYSPTTINQAITPSGVAVPKHSDPFRHSANFPPQLANHPKFRIVRELGKGGMGVVYLAEHQVMRKLVVLKVVNPAVLSDPNFLARFHSEVHAAGQLDHSNIARAHDADQAGDLHFLVMEYIDGMSLAQLLQEKGPLSVASACHCICQAAVGLQHAFEQGMTHRDIKPQNLMLTPKGQVKVLDFGLARLRGPEAVDKGLTQAGAFLGTPHYVAPEQATDAHSADTRADIYSLGCTLYALLTGRPPFNEDTLGKLVIAHLEKEPTPLHDLRPDVPAEVCAAAAKMLAKDPAKRFQRPIEVAQVLAPFAKSGNRAHGTYAAPSAGKSASRGTVGDDDTSPAVEPGEKATKLAATKPAGAKPAPFGDLELTRHAPSPLLLKKPKKREASAPTARWWMRPAAFVGGGVSLALLLVLVALWEAGVLRVKTKYGTVVLENLPADAEVWIDGGTVTVNSSDGKVFEVCVEPGEKHRLQVKKDGFKMFGEEVEIDAGGRKTVLVRLEPDDRATGDWRDLLEKHHYQTTNGRNLPYRLLKPRGLDAHKRYPLVLFLHGAGERGDDNDSQLNLGVSEFVKPENRIKYPCFLFAPQCPANQTWAIQDTQSEVMNLTLEALAELEKDFPIDVSRVYVTGLSMGGYGTWDVICRHPGVFAAAVPIAGVKGDEKQAEKIANIPIWAFHNAKDNTISPAVSRKMVAALRRAGGDPRYTEYPDAGHNAWVKAYQDAEMLQWLFSQKLFVPLFNGKDLAGWKTHPRQPGNWQVEEGILIGYGKSGEVSHLYTERGDYKDFHLRMKVRSGRKDNGVWFRAPFGPNNGPFPMSYNAKFYGLIVWPLPLIQLREISPPLDEWLTFEVIAKGNHLTVMTNGTTVADFYDDKQRYPSGHIALQMHEAKVEFCKIEIKELPPTKAQE
jgi:predicted esterase